MAAFLLILITGIAVAQNESEIQIFKMGTDVIVPAGQVMTDAVSFGGDVTILDEGQVTQDAVAIGGDVILQPNARVGGDAVAIGGQIIKEPGAIVDGNEVVIFSDAQVFLDRFGLLGTLYLTNALFSLVSLIAVLALGVVLLMLLPGNIKRVAATIDQKPLKSGMWGLGGVVAITLFAALFGGSIFGFLSIPIANLAFVIAALLGAIATGLWVGHRIMPRRETAFMPFLLGMLILAIISLVPIVGGLVILMLVLFGFGAVLLSRVGTVQPEKIHQRLDRSTGSTQATGG
ncbi:hypothetical protein IQ255_24520 [Pleurocapsales cyanobacterium LEGE 10410]|nr:hypothetical protein [Pleurocapsales cyanobacterium LEGE 10410]